MSPDGAAARVPVEAHVVSDGDGRSFLARALAEPAPGRTLVVTVPAPVGAPEALLVAMPGDGVLWHPARAGAAMFSGAGVARRIHLDGSNRFDALRREADALFATLMVRAQPGTDPAPSPRLFGGFSFAPGSASEPAWRGFGDGTFTLPRWTYARAGNRAWLSLSVAGAFARSDRDTVLDEHALICDALARFDSHSRPRPRARAARITALPVERFTALVEAVRAEIASGRFDKIVVARRTLVELFDGGFDDVEVLANLAESAADCTRFAFRGADATFLGATPERLLSRSGRRVSTEALAGTIGTVGNTGNTANDGNVGMGDAATGGALLASRKDLAEHAFVVHEITRRLSPLCARLDHPASPRVLPLRHLLHLHTPIEGELAGDVHVLDLVASLHPTPAVGGLPSRESVDWIAAHEPAPRGWYAAPVGWFDARGDGEFAVALRSGLIAGDRALVYAGAGIVRESDPASEYAETELKQRSLLGALGITGAVAAEGRTRATP